MDRNDFGFSKDMLILINKTEELYNESLEGNDDELSFNEWIDQNINGADMVELFENFTDKEKYLYAYGFLQGIITVTYDI